jgi:hypothetical protein
LSFGLIAPRGAVAVAAATGLGEPCRVMVRVTSDVVRAQRMLYQTMSRRGLRRTMAGGGVGYVGLSRYEHGSARRLRLTLWIQPLQVDPGMT